MKYEVLFPKSEPIWTCPSPGPKAGGVAPVGPAVAVLGIHTIEAREVAGGEVRWSVRSGAHQLFAISGSLLGSRGHKDRRGVWEAFDAGTGESAWVRFFDDWPPKAPAVVGEEAWMLAVKDQRALTALQGVDMRTGANLESLIAPFALRSGFCEQCFWTSRNVADSIGRGLMRYDRSGGEWETLSDEPHEICVADAHGLIAKKLDPAEPGGGVGVVAAYGVTDRAPVWRASCDGSVWADGELVHIAQAGELVELDRVTGVEHWRTPIPPARELRAATAVGQRVLLRFREGPALVLDAATGKATGSLAEAPELIRVGDHAVTIDAEEVAAYRL